MYPVQPKGPYFRTLSRGRGSKSRDHETTHRDAVTSQDYSPFLGTLNIRGCLMAVTPKGRQVTIPSFKINMPSWRLRLRGSGGLGFRV